MCFAFPVLPVTALHLCHQEWVPRSTFPGCLLGARCQAKVVSVLSPQCPEEQTQQLDPGVVGCTPKSALTLGRWGQKGHPLPKCPVSAFACVDTHVLRSVCGSCLSWFCFPRRGSSTYSTLCPARGRPSIGHLRCRRGLVLAFPLQITLK